jgi:hypothetical protein
MTHARIYTRHPHTIASLGTLQEIYAGIHTCMLYKHTSTHIPDPDTYSTSPCIHAPLHTCTTHMKNKSMEGETRMHAVCWRGSGYDGTSGFRLQAHTWLQAHTCFKLQAHTGFRHIRASGFRHTQASGTCFRHIQASGTYMVYGHIHGNAQHGTHDTEYTCIHSRLKTHEWINIHA